MRAAAFSVGLLLVAGVPGHAQTSPAAMSPPLLPGFVPPYEITRIVRSAGFDPLARPLREGTTYVVRATDFRGVLMRVVVDAQSGAIRAVNRIVAGPGSYGTLGMLPRAYDAPPPYDAPSPYARPEFGAPEIAPNEDSGAPPAPAPVAIRPAVHPLVVEPPLPRPRPPELATRKVTDDAKASIKSSTKSGGVVPAIDIGAAPAAKAESKPSAAVTAPATSSPNKPPAPAPMNE